LDCCHRHRCGRVSGGGHYSHHHVRLESNEDNEWFNDDYSFPFDDFYDDDPCESFDYQHPSNDDIIIALDNPLANDHIRVTQRNGGLAIR
jgi:hypothetical protein